MQHIAIIMDGNGRWAEARGLTRSDGHKAGADNISRIADAAAEAGAEFIRDAIVKLRTPPNAPITIKGGWMKKNGKSFKVIGKKSTVPLVDSGDMSKAPIYELRTKTA